MPETRIAIKATKATTMAEATVKATAAAKASTANCPITICGCSN